MGKRYELDIDKNEEPNTKPRKYAGESRFSGVMMFVLLTAILFGGAIYAEYSLGLSILDSINEFFDETFAPNE